MLTKKSSHKAQKYISLLQEARLNGQWSQVPELARKVVKHAPERSCLGVTAEIEATLAAHGRHENTTHKWPTTTALETALDDLTQALKSDLLLPEDVFEANVCLQHIHLNLHNWNTIAGSLRTTLETDLDDLSRKTDDFSPYLRVCILKSRYCVAVANEHRDHLDDARQVYRASIAYIDTLPPQFASQPEPRFWITRILARSCALHMHDFSIDQIDHAAAALKALRAWDLICSPAVDAPLTPRPQIAVGPDTTRRIWGLYYHLMSVLLELDHTPRSAHDVKLSVASDATQPLDLFDSRLAQRTEFVRVERAYEFEMLRDTPFPHAHQDNTTIDLWATQVMANWRLFSSFRWRVSDLGDGGRQQLGRHTLDIIYRAAAKTFHSTAILRYLFQLHAAVADLDLAVKAFDSYINIVTKAIARQTKTGNSELGLDTVDTVLNTCADSINLLCTYGIHQHAEKALTVATMLLLWLEPSHTSDHTFNSSSSQARAVAYHAVAQSKAHWATLTYDPSTRSNYMNDALDSATESVKVLDPPAAPDITSAGLLAVIFAETGNVNDAIRILKDTLTPLTIPTQNNIDSRARILAEKKRLVPLWHHLVLLLTAKEDYDTALATCSMALAHYADLLHTTSSEANIYTDSMQQSDTHHLDVLGHMDKVFLVQLKLTEIDLIATLDGPAIAMSYISELLSLYATLFGTSPPTQKRLQNGTQKNVVRPKSSYSTLRGIRNSIFGKPTLNRPTTGTSIFGPTDGEAAHNVDSTSTEMDETASSPTSDMSTVPEPPQHSHETHRLSTAMTSIFKRHSAVPTMPGDTAKHLSTASFIDGAAASTTNTMTSKTPRRVFSVRSRKTTSVKQGQTVSATDYNENLELDMPTPRPTIDPVETLSMPSFPAASSQRYAQSLLAEIWLFVAEIYHRDESYEDEKEAIEEAASLVESVHAATAQSESTARAFDDRGWGCGKSVGRQWADVWAQRGHLAISNGQPYAAMTAFECALDNFPDHPGAIVGLSTMLLDIYEEKLPAEPPSSNSLAINTLLRSRYHASGSDLNLTNCKEDCTKPSINGSTHDGRAFPAEEDDEPLRKDKTEASPAELNRIAARARAFTLLSSLTKLGEGWAHSEAWYVLARAYELTGQIERAKACLWWVVGLEDARPIRPWKVVRSV